MGGAVGGPPAGDSGGLLWLWRAVFAANVIAGLFYLRPTPAPTSLSISTTIKAAPMTLRSDGLDHLNIGMAWKDAVDQGMAPVEGQACVGTYRDATVYAHGDKVAAIVIRTDKVRTERGVGVGSTAGEVAVAYPQGVGRSTPVGGQIVVTEGGYGYTFGMDKGKVVYVWATEAGAQELGC